MKDHLSLTGHDPDQSAISVYAQKVIQFQMRGSSKGRFVLALRYGIKLRFYGVINVSEKAEIVLYQVNMFRLCILVLLSNRHVEFLDQRVVL